MFSNFYHKNVSKFHAWLPISRFKKYLVTSYSPLSVYSHKPVSAHVYVIIITNIIRVLMHSNVFVIHIFLSFIHSFIYCIQKSSILLFKWNFMSIIMYIFSVDVRLKRLVSSTNILIWNRNFLVFFDLTTKGFILHKKVSFKVTNFVLSIKNYFKLLQKVVNPFFLFAIHQQKNRKTLPHRKLHLQFALTAEVIKMLINVIQASVELSK